MYVLPDIIWTPSSSPPLAKSWNELWLWLWYKSLPQTPNPCSWLWWLSSHVTYHNYAISRELYAEQKASLEIKLHATSLIYKLWLSDFDFALTCKSINLCYNIIPDSGYVKVGYWNKLIKQRLVSWLYSQCAGLPTLHVNWADPGCTDTPEWCDPCHQWQSICLLEKKKKRKKKEEKDAQGAESWVTTHLG